MSDISSLSEYVETISVVAATTGVIATSLLEIFQNRRYVKNALVNEKDQNK